VAGWAGPAGFKGAVFWVGHVCHVVWRIEVDSVPAATCVSMMAHSMLGWRAREETYVGKRTAVIIPALHG
jgi:hypothetical protein